MTSYEDQVKHAATPREALLAVARGLDWLAGAVEALQNQQSFDPWQEWGDEPEIERPAVDLDAAADVVGPDGLTQAQRDAHTRALAAMSNTDKREFVLPEPSPEKIERRRMLERQQLKLAQALGADAGDIDWNEAYAKGGPWWLWQTRRDLVMGYDYSVRQMMVRDVMEDSPDLAYEMSLDVLKQSSLEPDLETGAGAMAPQGWVENKVRQ